MHRFYVSMDQIHGDRINIIGKDVNHIKNVLRMKPGDEIIICNGQGKDCYCIIDTVSEREITTKILSEQETGTELKTKITLYQGIPKKDKMELIIQKSVELGVYEIVPVMTKRVIVKLEDKKKELKKLERWQMIAESAAKQSGRGIIPIVRPVISYKEAILKSSSMDLGVVPYENAEGIGYTRKIMNQINQYSTIGIFIGPEGGFDHTEIDFARENNIHPITLGKRILRTETAGLAILSMMMLSLEEE
ncbi:MAG: 16S rRNA (uracil(1498)-N(3))-methyltransferase [Clostridiales bacterium]|nr:16S rRNA (uracil(1498)-N(3))-methyltransferase [Clostridiales bacterium]